MNVCLEGNPAGTNGLGEGRRAGAAAFESAIARIERAIADSCAERLQWPDRVAAGLEAAIEFLIANPGSARALVGDRHSGLPDLDVLYDGMVGRMALMLSSGAPAPGPLPASSARSTVRVIAAVVGCHIRAGTIDSLAKRDPDLVFLALLPHLGFAEASRWAAELAPAEAPQV
jgi:hypothetical protein